jgi:hypothetical protein
LKEISILRQLFRFVVFLGLTGAALASAGDNLVQEVPSGYIDWSQATVRVRGIGAPAANGGEKAPDAASDALENAKRVALSNLLETIQTIRINAGTRVADRATRSPDFNNGLASLAANAAVTRQEYLSDGTVEIELTMNLTGGFGQFVLPEEIRQVEPVTTVAAEQPRSDADNAKAQPADPFTGLIIDAGGIDARPSMVPVIVDESGEEAYGPAFVSREVAVSRGMSGFATNLEAARADPRVGRQPMIIKAIRTHSTGKTDLVISRTDAARLRSSAAHLRFLKACQVCIVIDSKEDA